MIENVNRFYNSIDNPKLLSQTALVELFVYFLTVELDYDAATPIAVGECFSNCDLVVPKNVAARLSEGLNGKPPKFVKVVGGYKLERHMREKLASKLGAEKITLQVSRTLRSLEQKMPEGADKSFLKEAIDCYEAGANRATVVMVWNLTMDHLFAYIQAHKLVEFNTALGLSTDRSIKAKQINQRDDFTDMKESKFIEFCRAARIITNDVRKILDQKLDTRNTCAHPSGVNINSSKVIDFVEDLVDNVILKYPV